MKENDDVKKLESLPSLAELWSEATGSASEAVRAMENAKQKAVAAEVHACSLGAPGALWAKAWAEAEAAWVWSRAVWARAEAARALALALEEAWEAAKRAQAQEKADPLPLTGNRMPRGGFQAKGGEHEP